MCGGLHLFPQALCGLVIDAGFSFTHVAPLFNGQLIEGGVKRINIGGKAMTNYLKETLSYR
jgi:actin-related protein 6